MKGVLVIFSLIFVFSHVYSQINDSPVIGKNSIQNPQDLNIDTQNKKMKDKRDGEDIGGSIGSQSSGSQIGATQLGQKDLLNDNKRKRRSIDESKLPSALEADEEVEKLDERVAKQGDDETLREKRQELIGYALKSNYLNDIILPYRKKREFQIYKRSPIPKDLIDMDNAELKNSGINLDSKSTQGAMVPMGIPVRLARDTHGSLIEVPINAKEVGRPLSSAEGSRSLDSTASIHGRIARNTFGSPSYSEVGISPKEVGRHHSSLEADDKSDMPPYVGTAAITRGRIPKHYMETHDEGFG